VRIGQNAHSSHRLPQRSFGTDQAKPSAGTQRSGKSQHTEPRRRGHKFDGRSSMRLNGDHHGTPHCRLFRDSDRSSISVASGDSGGAWRRGCEKATSRPGSGRAAGYRVSSSSSVQRRTERSTSRTSARRGSAGSTRCRPTVASPIAFIGISIGYCALSETSSDTPARLPFLLPAIRTYSAFGLCCRRTGSAIQMTSQMRGKIPSQVECQPKRPDPKSRQRTMPSVMASIISCTPHAGSGRPAVSPDVAMSVAYTESALDPLAIHDNATGAIFHPATKGALTDRLMTATHRPDLGLKQINCPANLAPTRLLPRWRHHGRRPFFVHSLSTIPGVR
jgi:hypothetical protein